MSMRIVTNSDTKEVYLHRDDLVLYLVKQANAETKSDNAEYGKKLLIALAEIIGNYGR